MAGFGFHVTKRAPPVSSLMESAHLAATSSGPERSFSAKWQRIQGSGVQIEATSERPLDDPLGEPDYGGTAPRTGRHCTRERQIHDGATRGMSALGSDPVHNSL